MTTFTKHYLKSSFQIINNERESAMRFITSKLAKLGWRFNIESKRITKHDLAVNDEEGYAYGLEHYLVLVASHPAKDHMTFHNEQELMKFVIHDRDYSKALRYVGCWDSLEEYLKVKYEVKLREDKVLFNSIDFEKLEKERRSDYELFFCTFTNKMYAIFERGEK